jgi:hypothetical protein
LDINSDLGLDLEDEKTGNIGTGLREKFEDELPEDDLLFDTEDLTGDLPVKRPSYADEDIELEDREEEIEEDEYEDEIGGPLGALAQKLPFLKPLALKFDKNKKNISVEEDEEFDADSVTPISYNDDDNEDEKPKKKITPIHIIIFIGIAYFGYDTYLEKIQEPKAELPKKKVVIKKKNLKKEIKTESKSDPEVEPVRAVVEKPKAVEPIKDEETLDNLFEDEPAPVVVQKPIINEVIEPDRLDELDALEDDASDEENSSEGEVVDVIPADAMNNRDQLPDDIIDDSIVGSSTSTDITESILKDLELKVEKTKKLKKIERSSEPVSAPEYEIVGRSLVYNCVDKHWACIDSINYRICGQNYSWNSDKGKVIECYPENVFDTQQDCAQVQQSKIDNVADTNFCQ